MTEEAVVGVGNPTMRDDGVGHRVVDELDDADLPETVRLRQTATSAFLALEAMSGADHAVVVDAVATENAAPGTVHRYVCRDGTFEGAAPDVLMHDLSFSDALTAGRSAYDLPPSIVVIGVEPGDLSVGLGLTDPVERAIPRIVATVREALATVEQDSVPVADRSESPTRESTAPTE
jgi:hydrogenase maturation protease